MAQPDTTDAQPAVPGQPNEITALRVGETSLVGQPAILQGFYLTKDQTMSEPAATTAEKANPAAPPPAGATPAAGAGTSAAPADQTGGAGKVMLPQAAKDAILAVCAQGAEALTKLGAMVKGAEVSESAVVPAEIVGALGQIAEMLETTEAAYETAPKAMTENVMGKELEPTAKAHVVADAKMANCSSRMMKKVGKAGLFAVAKAGLSRSDRVATIKLAMGHMLNGLLKDDEMGADEPITEAAKPPAPPPQPPPAATKTPEETVKAAGEPVVVAKSTDDPVAVLKAMLEPALGKLADVMGKLAETSAAQRGVVESLNQRLAAGASGAPAPNAVPVEKSGGSGKPSSKPWPRDLSEDVAKELAREQQSGANG